MSHLLPRAALENGRRERANEPGPQCGRARERGEIRESKGRGLWPHPPFCCSPDHRPEIGARLVATLRSGGSSAPSHPRSGHTLAAIFLAAACLLALAGSASAAVPNFCPLGQAAGQCEFPDAVAVDQSSTDVYVADGNNYRVQVFDSAGHFLRAFGIGVRDGAEELQTCTSACARGEETLHPAAIAIDNSGGPSSGDVYVFNGYFAAPTVEKYGFNPVSEEYEHLLSFGGPGSGPGQLSGQAHPLAVDSSGQVWVGDLGRLQSFSEAGAFLSEVPLPGRYEPVSLAIDPADDFELAATLNTIQEFTPPASGTYTLEVFGAPTGEIEASATAAEIEAALNALFGEQIAEVQGPDGGPYLIELTAGGGGRDVEVSASAGSITTLTEGGGPHTVEKLSPGGALLDTLDVGASPTALAVDPGSARLYVADNPSGEPGGATLLAFDSSGSQTAAFGSGEVIGSPRGGALAFGVSAQRLYVTSSLPEQNSAAQAFAVPPPGPLPLSGTSKATEIKKTAATLCVLVNPEGKSTTLHFEYITVAAFKEDGEEFGPGTISTSESAPIGSDFQPHEVCQPISPLVPASSYRFRVRATNSDAPAGILGETAEFSALSPAAIESTAVSEVTAESATLEAEINPLGDATSYRFEYLTQAAFLANGESFVGPEPATVVPDPPASIGAGQSPVAVVQHISGLAAETTYRFRVVALNAVSEANGGPFGGPVRAFNTQSAAQRPLPDMRGWEMVSPPEKHGGRLISITEKGLIQASGSGDAIAYLSSNPTETAPQGNPGLTQILSARSSSGWSSLDLNIAHDNPIGATAIPEYHFFSPDLSRALLQPAGALVPSLSPAASEETAFVRTDFPSGDSSAFCTSACYRPLVSGCPAAGEPCPPSVAAAADVPPGTVFGRPPCISATPCGPSFLGASPDLDHVVLASAAALTPGAPKEGLYEWSAAAPATQQLTLLSLLPGGEAAKNANLGLQGRVARGAISDEGSRVIFSAGSHLYVRTNATLAPSPISGLATDGSQCTEAGASCTIQIDEVEAGALGSGDLPAAHFELAAADASRIFFTDSQQLTSDAGAGKDLYEYDLSRPLGARLTDLTPASDGEAANVRGIVIGAAADGSTLYFVANGVLAHNQVNYGNGTEQALPGDCEEEAFEPPPGLHCNLYRLHDGEVTFIANLSAADRPDWAGHGGLLPELTGRVSSDGRYLAFMSQRPLTGYDNRDAVSGQRDEEVFLFDAGSGALRCASCNPTGARPHGVQYATGELPSLPLAAGSGVWAPGNWLAANVPGWTPFELLSARHQWRYLSDSGRLFFNSSDDLVPADSNGTGDVYQYEPPKESEGAPASDTCSQSGPSFVPAAAGCLDLISSGTSQEESAFLDASESGDDVFFLTKAQLSGRDFDTALDVYDARVGGGESEAVSSVECNGDACQQPAVPPNHPTPGTALLNGPGNVLQCPKGKVKQKGKCVKKKTQKHKNKGKKHNKKQKRANSKHGGQK